MKCQKNFKEMHYLKRHQQKRGKCGRCGKQFDLLTDFAKHSCERKQTENEKTPSKQEVRIENRITLALFEQRAARSLRF